MGQSHGQQVGRATPQRPDNGKWYIFPCKRNRGEAVRGQLLTIYSKGRLRHSLHPAMSPGRIKYLDLIPLGTHALVIGRRGMRSCPEELRDLRLTRTAARHGQRQVDQAVFIGVDFDVVHDLKWGVARSPRQGGHIGNTCGRKRTSAACAVLRIRCDTCAARWAGG